MRFLLAILILAWLHIANADVAITGQVRLSGTVDFPAWSNRPPNVATLLVHWENLPLGLPATAASLAYSLTNGTVGDYGFWQVTGKTNNDSFERFYIVNQPALLFPTPVQIGATTYTGSGTNWAAFDTATNRPTEVAKLALTGGPSGTITNLLVAGWVNFAMTNSTASSTNYDLLSVESGASTYCVCQMIAGNGAIVARAHSASNGLSTFGGNISLAAGVPYFRQLFRDATNALCRLRISDTNGSQIGDSECTLLPAGNSWTVYLRTGYLGNLAGTNYIGDTYVVYDATGFVTP